MGKQKSGLPSLDLIHQKRKLGWMITDKRGVDVRALLILLMSCLALFFVPTSVSAQEKTGVRDGFELKPGTARILFLAPNIRVGAQSTGGLFEPNADWTAQARENINVALEQALRNLGNEITRADETANPAVDELQPYRHLFGAVSGSAMEYQFFRGNRLPTKKRNKSFSWTVGPAISELAAVQGYDYVLFITTRDAYGSTGRKLLQMAAMFANIPVTSGEHVGYAGLVEVKTGNLVWLNADMAMGGDPRKPEGAEKRVRQLLEGFPGRPEADSEK
ncbi:MAG: hypothetical protein AAF127_13655 [Pseudomonadota bacterium]